ncbi:hypothetical protein Droror1_Dr00022876 [Drosera rotundifolia]
MSSASGEMTTTTSWVGKKPVRRVGGMSDALSIASDLGFRLSSPSPQPPPPSSAQEDLNSAASGTGEKDDDLIRVLRELAAVQRKIADLEVELRGRKDDKNVAHLTHVSEMEKKCETLARITTILKDVIQNKDRIIARLQQPYSLDCIPVEAEYQKQFSELLMRAASDYGALTASVADFQWTQNFKEPPSVWEEMLRPIPVALASCTRFFQAMSAMRESFATLQELRVGHPSALLPSTPASANDPERASADSDCMTPPHWRKDPSFDELSTKSTRKQQEQQLYRDGYGEATDSNEFGSNGLRRLSWPPPVKKEGL